MIRKPSDHVKDLYTDLQTIATEHEELTDTDVREALHLTLNHFFVWGKPLRKMPITFQMFSKSGDDAIREALTRFISAVQSLPELSLIPVGQDRLNILQDVALSLPGGSAYDEYIGYVDTPLRPILYRRTFSNRANMRTELFFRLASPSRGRTSPLW